MFEWGIGLIIASIVVLIILRIFFKTAFKIISIIWLVFFLASIAFLVLVYADISNMRQECPENTPVFLLQEAGRILAGVNMDAEGEQQMDKDAFVEDLDPYQDAYEERDFDEMIENDHCKIAVFNTSVFDKITNISFSEDIVISKDVFLGVLRAANPIQYFVDSRAEEDDLSEQEKQDFADEIDQELGTANKLKGLIFAMLVAKTMNEAGPSFVVENYNKGKIEVFKETLTFKMIKYMPFSLFESAMEDVAGKFQEEEEE